jgi:hypothetical protein
LQSEDVDGDQPEARLDGLFDERAPTRYYLILLMAIAVAIVVMLAASAWRYGWCSSEPTTKCEVN